ncbi:MAG: S1/P1 nuclease [Rhizomicrobium sp.]
MGAVIRFLLPLVLLLPVPARAWGPEGHEIVARIAADNLSPSAHLRISQIFGGDAPELMVLDSNWADEIRSARPATVPWHFVNIEVGTKGYNRKRDCRHDACVVAQIGRDVAVLQNPGAGHDARLEALRFLIHFVGDIHQPLHDADRHDKGGNKLTVYLGRRRSNLHRVWDENVVAALGSDPLAVAGSIERDLSPLEKRTLASGTPADWANEGFHLAERNIYAHLPARGRIRLRADYALDQQAIVRLQLARAGLRLAMLLNRIYR